MDPTDRRRERARNAQRRSRAQRRADLEGLQARLDSLTSALESITESSLQFSETVVSALEQQNPAQLRDGLQPFLRNVLFVARNVLEDEVDGRDDPNRGTTATLTPTRVAPDAGSAPPRVRNQAVPRLIPAAFELTRPVSPRLTYGLWPTATQHNHPPLDILPFLAPPQSQASSFALTLFWNTFQFDVAALEEPNSPSLAYQFYYSFLLYGFEKVRAQMRRRFRFKPSHIKSVVHNVVDLNSIDDGPAMDPSAVEAEFQHVSLEHGQVLQVMSMMNDRLDDYLDANGVEQRLLSMWGIDVAEMLNVYETQRDFTTSADVATSSLGLEMAMTYLASQSGCLGNGVGYPVRAVDEIAASFLNKTGVV